MDGRILDANNAAVQSYGYTYDELLGLNIRKYVQIGALLKAS